MDTRLATKQYRLRQWAEIIKDRSASGMKVNEYCKQNNLSRDAYYYWFKKLKEAALQQSGMVELTQSDLQTRNDFFSAQMVISADGVELLVNNDTPSELISRVLEVMHRA